MPSPGQKTFGGQGWHSQLHFKPVFNVPLGAPENVPGGQLIFLDDPNGLNPFSTSTNVVFELAFSDSTRSILTKPPGVKVGLGV